MNNFSSLQSSSFNLKNDYEPEKENLSPLQAALKKKREQLTDTKAGEKSPITGERNDKDLID